VEVADSTFFLAGTWNAVIEGGETFLEYCGGSSHALKSGETAGGLTEERKPGKEGNVSIKVIKPPLVRKQSDCSKTYEW